MTEPSARPPVAPSGGPDEQLTPLRRAFLAIEDLQARLAAADRARREPVAVIGVGCRLPGDIDTPLGLWSTLRDGVDAITEIPAERWDIDAYYDADVTAPGKMSTRHGGFLRDVDRFDAQMFGIAPREAAAMDPQQRLLLEVGWEALEHGGQSPAGLAGSRTGVFIGITTGDYAQLTLTEQGIEGLGAYYASGIAHSVASGRLSYVLGLEGPSISLDTACSSSLLAVHLAVQSLRTGESDMALAGGVNLVLSPEMSVTLSKYQMMAPDGRCKFGDARADGFVRGEGCGIVVLKRLDDAVAAGDRVLAVIRGSAVSQDGASSGLTAPNGPAQETVIRAALADAGVRAADVSYVEAHGTGTALGDPIEIQALGAVYGEGRPTDAPLLVGSAKSNLGHLEAAAGITGLLKLVVMLEHGAVPPSLHFETPSSHVDWDEVPVTVPVELAPWPGVDGRRLAGVSSFGFSGTNVHLVVDQPPPAVPAAGLADRPFQVLPLSARTEPALRALAARYADHMAVAPASPDPTGELGDLTHTAATGRSHLAHRLAVVTADASTAVPLLRAFAAGDEPGGLVHRHTERPDPPKVAFLFTGQGAQYTGMGRSLYEDQPVFRAALDECAEILGGTLGEGLLEVLFADAGTAPASLLDQTAYTQPAMVALGYALAELWESWGVTPSALLGHSVGEYTAAIRAGVFSLGDGLRLVSARGGLMQRLPEGGAMAAVFADADDVERAVAGYRGQLSLAAYNGPAHCVVAGPAPLLHELVDKFSALGTRTQLLNVSHAFHSALLDPMLDELEAIAGTVDLGRPRRRLISNLTAEAAGPEITEPGYWRRQARQPVRFGAGIEHLLRLGCDAFIEIGPHPTLIGMAQATAGTGGALWLPSLRRGRADWPQVLDSLAQLYAAGAAIDWEGFDRPYARKTITAPTYPFQRERHWIEPGPRRRRSSATGTHPVLGPPLRSPLQQRQFEQELTLDSLDYLAGHQVFGVAIMPGAAFVETALAAGASLGPDTSALTSLEILSALVVEPGEVRTLQTVITPDAAGAGVELLSIGDAAGPEDWTLHVRGRLGPVAPTPAEVDRATICSRCPEVVDAATHRARLGHHGLDFGPSLHGVQRIWVGDGEALGEIRLTATPGPYRLHPAVLDACLQTVAWLVSDPEATYLPIAVGQVTLHRPAGDRVWAYAVRTDAGTSQHSLTADVVVHDDAGAVVATLRDLSFKRTSPAALHALRRHKLADWLYVPTWQPLPERTRADLPAPAQLAAVADAASGALATARLDHHQLLFDELERLSGDYVVAALGALGVVVERGNRFRAEDLPVVGTQRRLVDRLLAGLAADGLLERDGNTWVVTRTPEPADLGERWDALVAAHPDGRGELTITRRCGEGLAGALRGDEDPLQLLFPGGSTEAAEQMYQLSPFAAFYNSVAGEALAATAAGTGAGASLRILEIGAGTGGTTAHLLPRLDPACVEYTYTDIAPSFVARAREKFSEHPFVEYAVLDIEKDPGAQGFPAHGYDVIVAANVLHATADLRRTFAHVAGLLAPGGRLLLLEMTKQQRFIDISFGLTPGWWLFTDTDLRPDSLLLDRDGWLDFLADAGFEAPVAVPTAVETTGADLSLQTMFMAGAPAAAKDGPLPANRRRWLILADQGGVGRELAELLESREADVAVIDDPTGDWVELVQAGPEGSPAGSWDAVVHLWSLDPASGSLDATLARRTGTALAVAQALLESAAPAELWLVTRGAQGVDGAAPDPTQAPLWGLGKVITLEHPELRCATVDLDPAVAADGAAALLDEVLSADHGEEIAFRGGARYRAVVRRAEGIVAGTSDAPSLALELSDDGVLDGIALHPATRRAPGAGEVEIRVHASGLNFRDVMNALAMRDDQGAAGSECAGVVVAVGPGVEGIAPGDAVVAITAGSFGTYAIAPADLVVRKPTRLSFQEAATLPLAFLTAHYALHAAAAIAPGDTVLVHAAAGGVGLASVQLARRAGARVLGTAGSERKRRYLLEAGVEAVYDSRTLDFAAQVIAHTGGRGVDVVINSLTGEFIPQSLRTLAPGGRFVELGKREVLTDEAAAALAPTSRYATVPLAEDIEHRPAMVGPLLKELVAAVEAGTLEPLPLQAFRLEDAATAFRTMAQAKHIGKVVLTDPSAVEEAGTAAAIRTDGTYLITGGLGGLGLVVGEWLVARGGRHLVLLGRHDPGPAADEAIARMEAAGAEVIVVGADVSDRAQMTRAMAQIEAELPPLRGVFHAAGVLDDGALLRQSWGRFSPVLAPKVDGAWNLHELTAGVDLDHFVLFSSAASLLGSAGQANHAAANSFLDALAAARRACGLPGLSINWGAWAEVGSVVNHGIGERITTQGVGTIAPDEGIEALATLMGQGRPQVGVVRLDLPVYVSQFTTGSAPGWLADLFAEVRSASGPAPISSARVVDSIRDRLLAVHPAEQEQLLLEFVTGQVARVLGNTSSAGIGDRQPLHELGLDSLMAVELRNLLGAGLGLQEMLPATLVFDHPTVEALERYLAAIVLAPAPAVSSASPATGVAPEAALGGPDDLLASIEQMSDEDVAQLLGE